MWGYNKMPSHTLDFKDLPEGCKQGRDIGAEGQLHICIKLLGEEVGIVHGLVWIRLPARPANQPRAETRRFLPLVDEMYSRLAATANTRPMRKAAMSRHSAAPDDVQGCMSKIQPSPVASPAART